MIFISYRRSDSIERAHLLKNILLSHGYDDSAVFLDMHDVDAEDFSHRCHVAILHSDVVVLIISKDSFETRPGNDYYYDEINWALDNHKQIVPVVFDGPFDKEHIPSHFVEKRLHMTNALNYSAEYHKEFESKFLQFVKIKNKRSDVGSKIADAFAMPMLILTLYCGVALIGGILRYVLDSYCLSDDSIVSIASEHVIRSEDGKGYLYPLKDVVYSYSTDGKIYQFSNKPIVSNQEDNYIRINTQDLERVGFRGVTIGLVYEFSKIHVKQAGGGKKVVVFIVAGVAIIAGVGLGFVLERMFFPAYQSRLITKQLDNPDFWDTIIARRSSETWINRHF